MHCHRFRVVRHDCVGLNPPGDECTGSPVSKAPGQHLLLVAPHQLLCPLAAFLFQDANPLPEVEYGPQAPQLTAPGELLSHLCMDLNPLWSG